MSFAHVKASNVSENLLNEVIQIIYSLCQAHEITKKACSNIMNLIQLWFKMDATFLNSKNSQASDLYRLLLNLRDKIGLKRRDKYVALSNISIFYTWKNRKRPYKNNKFKMSVPTWNDKLSLTDGSYFVLDIQDYFEYMTKTHETVTENRIIFKVKTIWNF